MTYVTLREALNEHIVHPAGEDDVLPWLLLAGIFKPFVRCHTKYMVEHFLSHKIHG